MAQKNSLEAQYTPGPQKQISFKDRNVTSARLSHSIAYFLDASMFKISTTMTQDHPVKHVLKNGWVSQENY